MTKIVDIGLPPRAQGALRKKFKTAEAAARKSDADLLAIEGFGKLGLHELRKWQARQPGSLTPVEEGSLSPPPNAKPPTMHQPVAAPGASIRFTAEHILNRLLEQNRSEGTALLAARMARILHDECARLDGVETVLVDGMVVDFKGEECIVRVRLEPGEEIPEGRRAGSVMLIRPA